MTDPTMQVSGDAKGGFIVSAHDGDRYTTWSIMADSAEAAKAEGLQRFHAEAPAALDDADLVTRAEVRAMINEALHAILNKANASA